MHSYTLLYTNTKLHGKVHSYSIILYQNFIKYVLLTPLYTSTILRCIAIHYSTPHTVQHANLHSYTVRYTNIKLHEKVHSYTHFYTNTILHEKVHINTLLYTKRYSLAAGYSSMQFLFRCKKYFNI